MCSFLTNWNLIQLLQGRARGKIYPLPCVFFASILKLINLYFLDGLLRSDDKTQDYQS